MASWSHAIYCIYFIQRFGYATINIRKIRFLMTKITCRGMRSTESYETIITVLHFSLYIELFSYKIIIVLKPYRYINTLKVGIYSFR